MIRKIVFLLLVFVALLNAQLRLPGIFSDNMILQHYSAVTIWGWAQPYQRVDVKGSWMALAKNARADSEGKWSLRIKAPQAGGPYSIVIQSGREFIQLNDVLSGEVWLCAGGMNMDMPLKASENGKQEILSSDLPNLRLFKVPYNYSDKYQEDVVASWKKSSAESSEDFSAVGFLFGKNLHQSLDVPVGIIQTTYNGAPAESWVDRDYLSRDAELLPILERFKQRVLNYPQLLEKYRQDLQQWEEEEKKDESEKPIEPILRDHKSPSSLYNGMIAPIVPYKFKGVIWYHGESNISRGWQYRKLFPRLIQSWRNNWNNVNMPFYFVQPAPYKYENAEQSPLFDIRESLFYTMKTVLNTGMVVTTDIGDIENIIPADKQDVANRLALWAKARDYGNQSIVFSGPLYSSMEVEDGKIRILFEHLGQGLVSHANRPLTCFTIAGEDKVFHPAQATIERNTVLVSSPQVKKPIAVRFAYENSDVPNLFNRQGLPAAPFRTDNFTLNTENNL